MKWGLLLLVLNADMTVDFVPVALRYQPATRESCLQVSQEYRASHSRSKWILSAWCDPAPRFY